MWVEIETGKFREEGRGDPGSLLLTPDSLPVRSAIFIVVVAAVCVLVPLHAPRSLKVDHVHLLCVWFRSGGLWFGWEQFLQGLPSVQINNTSDLGDSVTFTPVIFYGHTGHYLEFGGHYLEWLAELTLALRSFSFMKPFSGKSTSKMK